MRILAISDIHGSESVQYSLDKRIKEHTPDLVLVAGDITHFGPPEWAQGFLDAIPIDAMAIPGNCDPPGVIRAIEKSRAENLHLKKVRRGGFVFIGMGGSNPTPFPTLLESTEEEIRDGLSETMEHRSILLTHSPPYGHLDRTFIGTRVGSRGIQTAVERFRPILVVCGHIHEARGIEKDHSTTYVNPGKAANGYAAIINIEAEVNARLLEKGG